MNNILEEVLEEMEVSELCGSAAEIVTALGIGTDATLERMDPEPLPKKRHVTRLQYLETEGGDTLEEQIAAVADQFSYVSTDLEGGGILICESSGEDTIWLRVKF